MTVLWVGTIATQPIENSTHYIRSDAVQRLKRLQREVFEELVAVKQRITELERSARQGALLLTHTSCTCTTALHIGRRHPGSDLFASLTRHDRPVLQCVLSQARVQQSHVPCPNNHTQQAGSSLTTSARLLFSHDPGNRRHITAALESTPASPHYTLQQWHYEQPCARGTARLSAWVPAPTTASHALRDPTALRVTDAASAGVALGWTAAAADEGWQATACHVWGARVCLVRAVMPASNTSNMQAPSAGSCCMWLARRTPG